MMNKKEKFKFPLNQITRTLSPLIFIAIITLSFIAIFQSNKWKFQELSQKFSVPYDNSKQKSSKQSDETAREIYLKEFNDFMNQKSQDEFVWSSELQDWTLKRAGSSEYERPKDSQGRVCIWPEDCDEGAREQTSDAAGDRIINQLSLFDDHQESNIILKGGHDDNHGNKIFKILPSTQQYSSYPIGRQLFLTEACPITRCSITYDREEADALIFENSDVLGQEPSRQKRKHQIWIAYFLESPCHTFDRRFTRLFRGKHEFNWTASYRSDSDLVTPYSKFVPFQDQVREFNLFKEATKNSLIDGRGVYGENYALSLSTHQRSLLAGKKGKVAWFASNCNAANNRLEYAKQLAQHIQVDIYGRCGDLTCDKWNQTGCFEMINKNYKFYLSFENSNCRQYITEKFFRNALGYNDLNQLILPIVMGPPKEDYLRQAPPGSFIHVDDFESPKELAEYLKLLDSDDSLYHSYFHWKTLGRFIDTKFMCRVCALLHESHNSGKQKSYTDIKSWWTTCKLSSSNSQDCCT